MTKWLTMDDILPKRVPLQVIMEELGLQPEIKPPERPKRIFLQPGRSVAKTMLRERQENEFLFRAKLDKPLPTGETYAAILVRAALDGTLEIIDERFERDIVSEYDQLPPIPLDAENFMPTLHRRSSELFKRFWRDEEKPYELQEFPFKPLFEQRLPPRVLLKGKR